PDANACCVLIIAASTKPRNIITNATMMRTQQALASGDSTGYLIHEQRRFDQNAQGLDILYYLQMLTLAV
ncbi:hypothetical protein, partial [Francisella tularensis]|uniref:hypothetical protein n=1 Tax=Francisella tularensis TaxID=263 RepID=UPI0019504C6F